MNIDAIFIEKLGENELFSSEDSNGKYILNVGDLGTEPSYINPKVIETNVFPASQKLKSNLISLYEQVNMLTLSWAIDADVINDVIHQNKWLKIKYPLSEFGIEKIREELSGAINITRPTELIDTRKYSFLNVNGTQYFPFDFHYNLIACFKLVNGIIEDNIYLYNTQDSNQIHDMKVGCLEYLQLAYEAKLFYHWQYAYMFKDSPDNERLNTMLPEIFQFVELDLSKF